MLIDKLVLVIFLRNATNCVHNTGHSTNAIPTFSSQMKLKVFVRCYRNYSSHPSSKTSRERERDREREIEREIEREREREREIERERER